MADASDLDIQSFRIEYVGGLADANAIPLDDLIESMRGFERFFELTDSMFVQGRLSMRPLPEMHRISIRVRRIGPGGSIVAELEFVNILAALGLGVASAATWDGMKLAARKLWDWRQKVIESRVRPVRLPWSVEEGVASLEALARESGIRQSDDDDDPAEILQQLNGALQDATAPINHSVETIQVTSDDNRIAVSLGRAEKLAIESHPVTGYTAVESGDWLSVEVKFVKIHTETGHALIKFKKPQSEDQQGTKSCSIVDPRFKRANDPYTQTLSRRGFMHAWARKAIINPKSGAFRWELTLHPPVEQLRLFEVESQALPALPEPAGAPRVKKKKRPKRKPSK